MKLLMLILILFSQFAWPQVKTGTVIYVDFEKDEITIATDSRIIVPGTGKYEDTECKIAALGSKFVFSLSGFAERGGHWNAFSVAKQIWAIESRKASSVALLDRVVSGWVQAMEKVYKDPYVIADVRKHMTGEPVLANAIFGAIDEKGNLRMKALDITFDLLMFDATKEVKLVDEISEMPADSYLSMGHDEIVKEFREEGSPRAKDYMNWFNTRIERMPTDRKRAELASKFIELSILLSPDRADIGFPVDVLQLRKDSGVHWVWRKQNCRPQ